MPEDQTMRDLSDFVSDIHLATGLMRNQLAAGITPSSQDWLTFVELFCAAQMLWWYRHRVVTGVECPA